MSSAPEPLAALMAESQRHVDEARRQVDEARRRGEEITAVTLQLLREIRDELRALRAVLAPHEDH